MGGMRAAGAGEGNRTLVISLEGFCSTIELHPPDQYENATKIDENTSIPMCFPAAEAGGGGWIRTNVGARPTDLQSAPFSRSGTPPRNSRLSTRPGGSGKQIKLFQQVAATGGATLRATRDGRSTSRRVRAIGRTRGGCRHPES